MSRLINVMELLVDETIEEVFASDKSICGCERCRLDTTAIALNMLPTTYVVTMEGEVIKRTGALNNQIKVDIIRTLSEAMRIVAQRPHHSRKSH